MVLELGFSQINCSKEVRDYMRKGWLEQPPIVVDRNDLTKIKM